MIEIIFLIKEELKSKLVGIALIISLIIFISSAVISAKEYGDMITELEKNSEVSLVDWKRIETHNLNIAREQVEKIELERDKIKLQNAIEVTQYRIDNDISPENEQRSVKGFIEYNYFGDKSSLYIVTIIIMFTALLIPFDKSSLYYMDSMGYNKIFFSKLISGIIIAMIIWCMNFIITYFVGSSNFGSYQGEVISFISDKIVISTWGAYIFKTILLSLTYPVFSAIIPMMFSALLKNKIIALILTILIYLGTELLRLGYAYPNLIAKYSFIGNMGLLQIINGTPDLYLNSFIVSLIIDLMSATIIIVASYFGYKRVLNLPKYEKRIQET